MASKVFLHNKKSGRTYVYHNVSYWDKDEKKPKVTVQRVKKPHKYRRASVRVGQA